MSVRNFKLIKSRRSLERIARHDLEGKTLQQITRDVIKSDGISRVSSKANVGYVIEKGYFGIEKNNNNLPDLPHLEVEIKTSPLEMAKNGKLHVKEPLSLNIINYVKEAGSKSIKDSSLYKKNRRILFVWYLHDSSKQRSKYIIKYVFLWEMTADVLREIKPDYQLILEKIKAGKAHQIHQFDHERLTLCPKHSGKFKNPKDKKSKTRQPFSSKPAEVRAFRFKSSYSNEIIRRYLKRARPSELKNFVAP